MAPAFVGATVFAGVLQLYVALNSLDSISQERLVAGFVFELPRRPLKNPLPGREKAGTADNRSRGM